MISAYAESLAARLSFDRFLARRVRQEVEDHLQEAVAADAMGDSLEAQRRAIANFGDPHVIAAQFAMASLAGQTRKVGATVVLVIAGVFLAMASRVVWYDLTRWAVCEATRPLGETIGLIDRAAFCFAVLSGIAGWAYVGRSQTPIAFDPSYQRQLRRFLLLCTLAAGGLIASVVCDSWLTALRLSGWEFSVDFLIPLLSMAIEIVCASLLVTTFVTSSTTHNIDSSDELRFARLPTRATAPAATTIGRRHLDRRADSLRH